MAKPNYAFAKQQRDLAKEQKKEEKRQRRLAHEQAIANGEVPADTPLPDVDDEPAS